ncbi:tyrosine-type recombinase/integrase [Rhizobium cremeum]|uniref:tyrosine-type recombinase/integrase n=1 Tax=Rhizobium cremeum TaxID=2813827 RepID=UPI0039E1849B
MNVRADNPAKGVKKHKLVKHDRYLSVAELERLGAALKAVEAEGASAFAIAAIRFLALSGCRRSEALSMQWEWIDFQHNLVKLPDSKTGQKVLLLGKEALEFLKILPHVEGSPLVFPSASGGTTPLSIQKIWGRVRQKAGLEDVRLHDLRHNFASTAVSSGLSLYIAGKLLGHSQPQTTQRYAHLALDPIRAAADEIAASIARKLQ